MLNILCLTDGSANTVLYNRIHGATVLHSEQICTKTNFLVSLMILRSNEGIRSILDAQVSRGRPRTRYTVVRSDCITTTRKRGNGRHIRNTV